MGFSGEPHKLLPLDELVASLVKENIRAKIMAREDELERIFKYSSKVGSEYDAVTEDMIKLLHKTRDEQVVFCEDLIPECFTL